MIVQCVGCFPFFLLLVSTFAAAQTDSIDTRTGHTRSVNAIAFSSDGTILASGSEDQTVKLWSVITGKEIRTIDTKDPVQAIAVSPDGKKLATSGFSLVLWDEPAGKEIRRFEDVNCRSVLFSPDGKLIACGADDKVTLLDVETGDESLTLDKAHAPAIFNPNGKQLITASGDDLIRVWDVNTGNKLQTIEDVGKVSRIVVSANGLFMACANNDETKAEKGVDAVKLFNFVTGRIVRTFKSAEDDSKPVTIAFSPDNKSLALGYSFGFSTKGPGIRITNILTGSVVSSIGGAQSEISDQNVGSANDEAEIASRDLVYSRDGKYIASVKEYGKSIYLWSVTTGKKQRAFEGHSIAVESIVFSLDDKSLFTGGDEGALIKWDVATGKMQKLLAQIRSSALAKLGLSSLAISADGKTIATTSGPRFHLLDASSGSETGTNKVTLFGSPILSPDLKYVATATDIVTLYALASGEEMRKLLPRTTESQSITAISFSPDVRSLAGVTKQGITIWDINTGSVIRTLRGTFAYGSTIKYSPDNKLIACGCDDGSGKEAIKIWDVSTGVLQRSFENQATKFAFSPDSRTMATIESVEAINLFDVASGKKIRAIKYEDLDGASAMAFSHDGKILALATQAGAKLVDVDSAQVLRTLAHNLKTTQPFANSAVQQDSASLLEQREK
jgi:WD40 repeat protein